MTNERDETVYEITGFDIELAGKAVAEQKKELDALKENLKVVTEALEKIYVEYGVSIAGIALDKIRGENEN